MRKNSITKYIITSLCIFLISLSLFVFSSGLLKNFFGDPNKYINSHFSAEDIRFFILNVLLIFILLLISWIIYLLLSVEYRAASIAGEETESITISLTQFTKLYEESPVPYVILDEAGNINDPNKATLRFFEASREEIEGQNLFYFCSKEDKEKSEKLFEYYKSDMPINKEELQFNTKKENQKFALVSVFLTKGFGPSNKGLATIFDITERKKLDKAKTEFLSLASHQLRTPTATIKWYADMLLSGSLGEFNEKQKDYINTIQKVNQNMIEITNTLLNISKIEVGSIKPEKKLVNVKELTESIFTELNPQISEKNLNIKKQYNDKLKNVEIDPKFLKIVIHNLISNAVKYTPEGGTISVKFEDSSQGRMIIVSDTGIGIPKAEQDKVFSKLFRAENARNVGTSQSSGLGLYLVKSLIENMGGNIEFSSIENQGSTFIIRL
ncbi:MAG: PAS domain S-box protein [Candidatus Zambryskibacteria bacterium]|nr:PAS domain S-box protein [Candidatus Zambryskibacteria bacterium]